MFDLIKFDNVTSYLEIGEYKCASRGDSHQPTNKTPKKYLVGTWLFSYPFIFVIFAPEIFTEHQHALKFLKWWVCFQKVGGRLMFVSMKELVAVEEDGACG